MFLSSPPPPTHFNHEFFNSNNNNNLIIIPRFLSTENKFFILEHPDLNAFIIQNRLPLESSKSITKLFKSVLSDSNDKTARILSVRIKEKKKRKKKLTFKTCNGSRADNFFNLKFLILDFFFKTFFFFTLAQILFFPFSTFFFSSPLD